MYSKTATLLVDVVSEPRLPVLIIFEALFSISVSVSCSFFEHQPSTQLKEKREKWSQLAPIHISRPELITFELN